MPNIEDELVMYIVARTDLAMSHGKFGAQCGHGVQLAMREAEKHATTTEALQEWESKDYPKIVLGIKGEEALVRLQADLLESGIPSCIVKDLGRTEIAANSLTILTTVPILKSRSKNTPLKRLRLY